MVRQPFMNDLGFWGGLLQDWDISRRFEGQTLPRLTLAYTASCMYGLV